MLHMHLHIAYSPVKGYHVGFNVLTLAPGVPIPAQCLLQWVSLAVTTYMLKTINPSWSPFATGHASLCCIDVSYSHACVGRDGTRASQLPHCVPSVMSPRLGLCFCYFDHGCLPPTSPEIIYIAFINTTAHPQPPPPHANPPLFTFFVCWIKICCLFSLQVEKHPHFQRACNHVCYNLLWRISAFKACLLLHSSGCCHILGSWNSLWC